MNNTPYPYWLATALLLILVAPLGAQCDTIDSELRIENNLLFYTAGSEETNFDVFPVTGPLISLPISGQLQAVTPPTVLGSAFEYREDLDDGSCRSISARQPYPVTVFTFVPETSATYTFAQNSFNPRRYSFSLFTGRFDPSIDNCPTFISSTFADPSINRPGLDATLEAGKVYSLVVLPGEDFSGSYPRSFSINVTESVAGLNGRNFYVSVPFAPNYGYTYIAVNENETISAVSDNGNFRSLGEGNYQLYGVNYDSSTVNPTTFTNGNFESFQLQSNGERRCLEVSSNSESIFLESDNAAPVDWLTFRAETTPRHVNLRWDVASETENDYFRIERSSNGSQWTDIGEVAGNGTTQTYAAFEFTDRSPLSGTSYYRLAQVDFDGTENFSTVVEARRAATGAANLVTYPNPFDGQLTIQTATPPTGTPRLFDVRGRDLSDSITVRLSGEGATLNTAALPQGVYLLRWGGEEVRVVKR